MIVQLRAKLHLCIRPNTCARSPKKTSIKLSEKPKFSPSWLGRMFIPRGSCSKQERVGLVCIWLEKENLAVLSKLIKIAKLLKLIATTKVIYLGTSNIWIRKQNANTQWNAKPIKELYTVSHLKYSENWSCPIAIQPLYSNSKNSWNPTQLLFQ